jgi:hypothetical protein
VELDLRFDYSSPRACLASNHQLHWRRFGFIVPERPQLEIQALGGPHNLRGTINRTGETLLGFLHRVEVERHKHKRGRRRTLPPKGKPGGNGVLVRKTEDVGSLGIPKKRFASNAAGRPTGGFMPPKRDLRIEYGVVKTVKKSLELTSGRASLSLDMENGLHSELAHP